MLKINIKQIDNVGTDFIGSISPKELGIDISLKNDDIEITKEVQYNLHISSLNGDILVMGEVKVPVKAECGRCVSLYEFQHVIDDTCHFFEDIRGDYIDIAPELREDILLKLPSKYLCSEKCKGVCPICGINLNKNECKCEQEEETTFDEETNFWGELDKLDL